MRILQGRLILLTGGARGIGIEIAENMANEGVEVIIHHIRTDKLQVAVNKLLEQRLKVQGILTDITDDKL